MSEVVAAAEEPTTNTTTAPRFSARSLSQVHKWWASKIAPLLAVGYLALTLAPRELGDAAERLLVMLWSACLLATAAYVVNDWFDREEDRVLGKQSMAMRLSGTTLLAIYVVLLVLAITPWFVVELPAAGWAALAAIVLLPLVYSAPPLRWKERGLLGVVADASLAHVAPATFALANLGAFELLDDPAAAVVTGATLVWAAAIGVRSIVDHEVVDAPNDRAAGVVTWVTTVGEARATQLIATVLLPVELVALAAMFLALGDVTWVPAALTVALVVGLFVARRAGAWLVPLQAVSSAEHPRPLLFVFYKFWFGTILLVGLVVEAPDLWPILPAHLLLFLPLTVGSMRAFAHSTIGTGRRAYWLTHDHVWHPVVSWLRYRLPERTRQLGRAIRGAARRS